MKFVNGNLVEQNTDPLPPNIRCEVQWQDVGFILVLKEDNSSPEKPPITAESAYKPLATAKQSAFRSAPDAISAGAIARRSYGL